MGSGSTTVMCRGCGHSFEMSPEKEAELRQSGDVFFCPRGCRLVWPGSVLHIGRQIVSLHRAVAAMAEQPKVECGETALLRRRVAALKGVITKLRKKHGA